MVPVHNQVTAGGQVSRGERAAAGRHNATAKMNRDFQFATWNVNTLWQPGKFESLKKEASRLNLDIVGVSEVRCTGVG